jgi:hypothetical protein
VYEKMTLMIIHGPKREEVTDWTELDNPHFPSAVTRVFISRRVGWAGYAASMGRIRKA